MVGVQVDVAHIIVFPVVSVVVHAGDFQRVQPVHRINQMLHTYRPAHLKRFLFKPALLRPPDEESVEHDDRLMLNGRFALQRDIYTGKIERFGGIVDRKVARRFIWNGVNRAVLDAEP